LKQLDDSINVFLDDLRPCPIGFVLAKNAEECLALLNTYHVKILSLDHDLGWDEMNGSELALEMANRGLYADEIYLHSSSMAGRMNMYEILTDKKPDFVTISMQPLSTERLMNIANGK
jgi:hypothetical protein